ncbi:hypothetical protein B0O80DRAFT_495269 [Mortierella sp. GBAus27b]|nr:hypothetical protein B0O80DRAFT_495269 [Mortierella sp. GBAus27b]
MKLIQRDPLVDDSNVYEIQQILNHRKAKGKKEMEYLVSWKGYPSEDNSWVPLSDFTERTMIEEYRKRRGIAADEEQDSDKQAEGSTVQTASKAQKRRGGPIRGSRSASKQGATRTTVKAASVPRKGATRKSKRIAAGVSNK